MRKRNAVKLQSTGSDMRRRGQLTKSELLLALFREYNNLPLTKCMANFAKVFNDVFINDLPSTTQSYMLSETMICELTVLNSCRERLQIMFQYSFTNNTTRWINFASSLLFRERLQQLCRQTKMRDNKDDSVDLHKRGMRHEPFTVCAHMESGRRPLNFEVKEPMHGKEYFFSNVMVKVYQLPMLFGQSSEFGVNDHEGTFIVLVYEKVIKKRQARTEADRRI